MNESCEIFSHISPIFYECNTLKHKPSQADILEIKSSKTKTSQKCQPRNKIRRRRLVFKKLKYL